MKLALDDLTDKFINMQTDIITPDTKAIIPWWEGYVSALVDHKIIDEDTLDKFIMFMQANPTRCDKCSTPIKRVYFKLNDGRIFCPMCRSHSHHTKYIKTATRHTV